MHRELEGGKVSAFDCHYAGTILLGQLGVLGNLEASLKIMATSAAAVPTVATWLPLSRRHREAFRGLFDE